MAEKAKTTSGTLVPHSHKMRRYFAFFRPGFFASMFK